VNDPDSLAIDSYRGRGTVWIAADRAPSGTLEWFGYWDIEPDGAPRHLEDGPRWQRPEDAVAWGRERTPRVLIRLDEVGGYWWAGIGPPPREAQSDIEGVFEPEI
jgi:hypothetical protein